MNKFEILRNTVSEQNTSNGNNKKTNRNNTITNIKTTETKSSQFCNNCGLRGHSYNVCKYPITSIGVIAYKYDVSLNDYVFLMIRRRNTLGFVDFMRGKYNLYDKQYIQNLINEMTIDEKEMILYNTFNDLWGYLWQDTYSNKYKNEEKISSAKFETLYSGVTTNNETYTLEDIVNNSTTTWKEEEWGFPKGRRSYQEKDTMTALREFSEETGYSINNLELISNVIPFQEIFTGSNFKSYKHKYYLGKIIDNEIPKYNLDNYQMSEVSMIKWKTLDECLSCIRPYNKERIRIIKNVYNLLHIHNIVYT